MRRGKRPYAGALLAYIEGETLALAAADYMTRPRRTFAPWVFEWFSGARAWCGARRVVAVGKFMVLPTRQDT
jgi:hypothetical protein